MVTLRISLDDDAEFSCHLNTPPRFYPRTRSIVSQAQVRDYDLAEVSPNRPRPKGLAVNAESSLS